MEHGKETPTCVVYAGRDVACNIYGAPCRPADVLLEDGVAARSPAVLLMDDKLIARIGAVHALPEHVVIVATDAPAAAALGERAELSFAGVEAVSDRRAILHAACQTAIAQFMVAQFEEEFHEVSRIGIALMREHDRKALLRMIVVQSKALTVSDGGGLLLATEDEDGRQWLRPVLYAFDSIEGEFLDDPEPRYAVDDTTIIGHAARLKKPVVIADVYDLPRNARYEQAVAFDIRHHYRRRSMLCVPMLDQMGHLLGVLICVNRKTDPKARINTKEDADRCVIEYSKREVRLVRMLASEAAVAIENARLYAQVENTLESFVRVAVGAIDLRDPTTAGHSLRVAELATTLAQDLERRETGAYRDVRLTTAQMRELRFAALLHDIGKIAVSEHLLLKAKKLPAGGWERIDARFDLIARTMQLESCRAHMSSPSSGAESTIDVDEALAEQLEELERLREVVHRANEPTVLDAPIAAELASIAKRTYQKPDGTIAPFLTPEELHYLQLQKGNLDDAERAEVEAHVSASRDLLANIPWTDDLKEIVTYAYGHHEMLNGNGYPRHLTAEAIPLQTRLITIADIYDALTAADRPYKPAVSPERAMEILQAEAEAGLLDPELVKVMAESASYRRHLSASQPEL
ncbi:MAG TPA: HD domain-containing phosphohydrolase [Gemmatimonadaceae bacterium]